MKPIHDVTLARTGICRTMPNAIKFGPTEMMGLGFKNIFLTQEVDKLALFLEEHNRGGIASKLLQENFELDLLYDGVGEIGLFRLHVDNCRKIIPKIWIK